MTGASGHQLIVHKGKEFSIGLVHMCHSSIEQRTVLSCCTTPNIIDSEEDENILMGTFMTRNDIPEHYRSKECLCQHTENQLQWEGQLKTKQPSSSSSCFHSTLA